MPTRTRFVFLMHPEEFKHTKAATGRLTHLSLADSVIHMGIEFDAHEAVQTLIRDPANYPVVLYPAREAVDLSRQELPAADFGGRRLTVFLLDATWRLARRMWKASPSLQALPKVMFSGAAPSRYVIKTQPEPGCLSTLEATHELLTALDRRGLDHYARPTQLLDLFARMQDLQLRFAAESQRLGRRRHTPRPRRGDGAVAPVQGPKRRRIFPRTAGATAGMANT